MTPSADDDRRPRLGTGADRPSVFPTGPSRDHPRVPVSRPWRIAGLAVGGLAVVSAAAVLVTAATAGPDYETIRPSSVVIEAPGSVEFVDIELRSDPALTREAQIRVDGDGLIRVDIESEELCAPASGAAGGWIDLRFCAPLRSVTVTAFDIDDEVTTVVAEF